MSSLEVLNASDPPGALRLSQRAPEVFRRAIPTGKPFPFSLLEAAESPDTWTEYEQLLVACLRTGDDKAASLCLERLTQRFGATDDRIRAMKGLYQEATAKNQEDLEKVLDEYDRILSETPMNLPVQKRKIALLRSLSRPQDATIALVEYVESNPTDAEAWCELADLYQSQGLFSQAIFCAEEALLITPNAWNVHARLGELQLIAAASSQEGNETAQKLYNAAIGRFCRSIELCDDYLRGYYGLKTATSRYLQSGSAKSGQSTLAIETVKDLNSRATQKLKTIIEHRSKNRRPSDVDEAELIAVRELLDRSK
ncbi:MAG: hypothetical protein Q9227_006014 [Pyrenula ochraceoflavens]